MRQVPKRKLITLTEICARLAKQHGTRYCCTLTTGIMVITAVNAAAETGQALPYWHTIRDNGEPNPKYLGGVEGHKTLFEGDGFSALQKGKRFVVENFEKSVQATL